MGRFIAADDLTPFAAIDSAKAEAMIADAEAMALVVAPCLGEYGAVPNANAGAAVKAILRSAILRWHETGSGAVTQQTAGPFSQSTDTRQVRKGMFWPSEIEQLQAICQPARTSGGAFSVILAGHPIYELG